MSIRSFRIVFAAFLLGTPGLAPAADDSAQPSAHLTYYGNYRIAGDHLLGIDRFITDDGQNTMLISDYSSGVVRRLFPASDTEFVMGPGFNVASPAELTVRFVKDERGTTTGISLRYANGTQTLAERVPLKKDDVFFVHADAKLQAPC